MPPMPDWRVWPSPARLCQVLLIEFTACLGYGLAVLVSWRQA